MRFLALVLALSGTAWAQEVVEKTGKEPKEKKPAVEKRVAGKQRFPKLRKLLEGEPQKGRKIEEYKFEEDGLVFSAEVTYFRNKRKRSRDGEKFDAHTASTLTAEQDQLLRIPFEAFLKLAETQEPDVLRYFDEIGIRHIRVRVRENIRGVNLRSHSYSRYGVATGLNTITFTIYRNLNAIEFPDIDKIVKVAKRRALLHLGTGKPDPYELTITAGREILDLLVRVSKKVEAEKPKKQKDEKKR